MCEIVRIVNMVIKRIWTSCYLWLTVASEGNNNQSPDYFNN